MTRPRLARPGLALICATALGPAIISAPATASSPEAWDEFRKAVLDACTELAAPDAQSPIVAEVNPFGSESFGAALITKGQPDGTVERMICIYDKQDGRAEITGPFLSAPATAP
ncbi:MAG: hypothetical protein Q4G25_15800 [Paracoccus sp. (in: a-proteobacteria)]|nr:hypothetical protein [Paracoccus sp. (in: a-proteobacteria)]